MTKNESKSLDDALRHIADALRRCRISKTALAGLSAISSSIGTDALATSTGELQAAAEQLRQRAEDFHDRVRTIHATLQEVNGAIANAERDA